MNNEDISKMEHWTMDNVNYLLLFKVSTGFSFINKHYAYETTIITENIAQLVLENKLSSVE